MIFFHSLTILTLAISSIFSNTESSLPSEIPDESCGYVEVREGAYMFWLLYGADTSDSVPRKDKPLLLWLQGGPGASSTGFGNFEEIGPLDVNLNKRSTTGIKEANVLFVDNPVGCGYSYVLDKGALTTNISGITSDFMIFFRAFLEKLPVFETIPFYMAGESYGGKMVSAFGVALYEAIQEETIQCKFMGIALGDSLISFPETVLSYGPYLYSLSLLDEKDFHRVQDVAGKIAKATEEGDYETAMYLNDLQNKLIASATDNVDVYYVLRHNTPDFDKFASIYKHILRLSPHQKRFPRYIARTHSDSLFELMNGPIRKKLKIIPDFVTWGGQSGMVAQAQKLDIPSSVLSDVSKLLRDGVKVVVYEGQLDMICGILGAESWIKKLNWDYLPQFSNSSRKPLYVQASSKIPTKHTAGFLKAFKNFELYYILKAGHMVPKDAPEMALEMLINILK
ncbi:retinoid-inducible serine carboxypeptidase-like [Montipora foliosa]|uniref:retinoid-inducible serine carboxypeptidase-like n=1 Tax=Montipora foliosa TaxID=591990 RepID=UPI0035F19F49